MMFLTKSRKNQHTETGTEFKIGQLSQTIQDMSQRIFIEHERAQVLLDAMPLITQLWNRNLEIIDCNDENTKLFKLKTKKEFVENFDRLSPMYQNDGQLSSIKAREVVKKAFEEGKHVVEWMHNDSEGTPLPMEVTLVRVTFGNEDYVVSYGRDLREYKRMMSEIKQHENKLHEALTDAQKANKAKSCFLARMSHEMRTPLNAIIGLSDLTLESGEMSAEAQTNLERINSAGVTLLSTVNDILDISKIEAGKFELTTVDYDIPSLLNDAITQSIMRLGSKPVNFVLNINEDLPARLHGDDLRIKQILNNLLSNAFKYTKEGEVKLSVSCNNISGKAELVISVSDTGIGIRESDINALFCNYTQADLNSNRTIEGTGLGLPITKQIAEMMNGNIKVQSVYGKGSVFTVTLQQQFVSGETIGSEVVKSLQNFNYTDQKRKANYNMIRLNIPHVRVLVVDDVLINLEVAKGMMKPYGMEIDCVTSGQQAIDAIRSEEVHYNAIFMDHMMPGMDGIEAVRIIRQEIGTEYAKKIPIIALTANAISGNEAMFLQNGFQAFLPKPIEVPRLDSIIRQWINNKNCDYQFVKADDETEQQKDISWVSESVDLQKGLERFGFNKSAYIRILKSFTEKAPAMIENIKDLRPSNFSDYAIKIHGIKGAAYGISANKTGAYAETLEKAAKSGDIQFVLDNNPVFIEEMEKLAQEIKEMLGSEQ